MTIDYKALNTSNRLLLEVDLSPIQGTRFQPTGFPNLGAANYLLPGGEEVLLVESAQSMANRLEAICWDVNKQSLADDLHGLPYVEVVDASTGEVLTNSLLEAHRLNSPYILESADTTFKETLQKETLSTEEGPVDIHTLARIVFKYDAGAVLHGVFLVNLGNGRLRLPRLLSSFIEARNVRPAESGGVKIDRINPAGDTKKGFGHVPFHRTEFVAERITAYFNLDLAALRAYDLGSAAERLLINLSLWKIMKFLSNGLRLRTACDLESSNIRVTRPEELAVPDLGNTTDELKQSLVECASSGMFAIPPVTRVSWTK